MKNLGSLFLFITALLAFFAGKTFAHGDHHNQSGSPAKPPFCISPAPENISVPDFEPPRWQKIDDFTVVVNELPSIEHRYIFFYDSEQKNLPIAGFVMRRGEAFQIGWQIGEEKFTFGMGSAPHKELCVTPVVTRDGSRRDLTEFYARVRNQKELTDMPETARAHASLLKMGEEVPWGYIETTCKELLKSGEPNMFRCRIVVLTTTDVAVFFYNGPSGQPPYPLKDRWIAEIRWKEAGKKRVWSRHEVTVDDGGRIILDPSLHQRPEFAPQAPDELF